MHILLIHQYFLEKDDPGGSRFNEMARVWADDGHQVTVIAGMVHYTIGKKRNKHKGKFIVKEAWEREERNRKAPLMLISSLSYVAIALFYVIGVLSSLFRFRDVEFSWNLFKVKLYSFYI